MSRIGVLASGGGSNLEAILAAGLPVAVVVVDRPCRATELAVPGQLRHRPGQEVPNGAGAAFACARARAKM